MTTPRRRNPNGAGTITKRKDGRYQAAVYVLQPDGTRARKFAYGKTWAECDTKRRDLLTKVDRGVPVPTRSAKLAAHPALPGAVPRQEDAGEAERPGRTNSSRPDRQGHDRGDCQGIPPCSALGDLGGLPRGTNHAQRRQARRSTQGRRLRRTTLDAGANLDVHLRFPAGSALRSLHARRRPGPAPRGTCRSALAGHRPGRPHGPGTETASAARTTRTTRRTAASAPSLSPRSASHPCVGSACGNP